MKESTYILMGLGQFAITLALITIIRLLFGDKFSILWRDVFLSLILAATYIVQTHLTKRKQDRIDKLAEENRRGEMVKELPELRI